MNAVGGGAADGMNERGQAAPTRGLDIYVVLAAMVGVAALLTWILPAGEYERAILADGRETVVPGSYRQIEPSPAGFMELLTAIPEGLTDAAGVVFLVFLVGGSVGVVRRAGIVDLGVRRLTAAAGHRLELLIPALMFSFAAVAGVVGMQELSIAYLPIVMPLLLRFGCSRTTATAVALLPPTLGSAFGVTVPATVGIGHLIAGLPLFSGAAYRFVFFLTVQAVAAFFVVRRARRERTAPGGREKNPVPPPATEPVAADFTGRQRAAAVTALLLFIAFVVAVLTLGFGFEEISGAFVAIAVVVSLVAGRSLNRICSDFNESFREILVGALVCGVARGVSVVMTEGQVMDTVVHGAALMVSSLPSALTAVGILLGQAVFNFLVPSGSGQALITLPILVPIGDLAGVTRQVVVLATQWGDGMTNVVFPTSGYFMATLVMARVGLSEWLRYYLPLFAVILAIATAGLVVAHAVALGPF